MKKIHYEKALKIIAKHKNKENMIEKCLEAGICPKCGNNLELERSTVFCSKGCLISSKWTNVWTDYYRNCVNDEIFMAYMSYQD